MTETLQMTPLCQHKTLNRCRKKHAEVQSSKRNWAQNKDQEYQVLKANNNQKSSLKIKQQDIEEVTLLTISGSKVPVQNQMI